MSRQVVTLVLLAALAVTASLASAADRDPRAEQLARATMGAMGGEEAFSGARILRFDFRVERDGQLAALYHHWWDRTTGDYRLEGVTPEGAPFRALFNVGSRRGQVWIGTELLGDEAAAPHLEQAYGRFINDSYWLLMPWKWLDPGVLLAWEGEREEDGRLHDVVRLSFEPDTGLTSNDRYWAYVARDSGLMERWAYVLEGEDGRPGSEPPTEWAWDGWRETQAGIRVSTVKRRLGEGPPLAISFPVAAAFRELSSDAMAAAFHPSAPLAPPAAASGTAPSAAGLSSVLAVLNKSEHAVALVDTDTLAVVRRVPTGVAPHEAAVSRDGRTLYVANYGGARPGDSLTVIDLPSGEVSRTVSLGEHTRPHGLAVGPDGSLWVTAEGSGSLLRLSPADLSVAARYATGQEVSHMVALSPDGARAFVTSIASGSVTAVDAASGEVRSVATGAGAEGIDVTPDGLEVWVAHREADELAILDAATLEVKGRVSTGAFPIRVKVTPDGTRVLVSCAESEELLVFDRAERRQVGRVALASAPIGIQLTPDGRRAFIAATGADEVAVVDLERLAVTGTIRPGDEPDGMAFGSW